MLQRRFIIVLLLLALMPIQTSFLFALEDGTEIISVPMYDEPLGGMDISKFEIGDIVSGPTLSAQDLQGKVVFFYQFFLY